MTIGTRTPAWAWIGPVLAFLLLGTSIAAPGLAPALTIAAVPILIATVFAAVYHAEVVAHRVGEPFGTLVLAVAVTVIEVALIVSLMLEEGPGRAELARDTVFAAVMLVCNGIVGVCLLMGGVRHHEQGFQLQGASAALAVLAALTVLTLVVPNVTVSAPGPMLTTSQLVFAAAFSLVLYGSFVFVQTVRHRDYFLPDSGEEDDHAPPPPARTAWSSGVLLVVALTGVVGLAKKLSPLLGAGVRGVGAPETVVGIMIAALVLTPEGLAALRAARRNRLQTSMNLALGSALASIGLTVPVVSAASILFDRPISLGLDPKESVLLALTLLVSIITLGTGRTTVLQGVVHLAMLAAFLFLAVVP